MPDAPPPENRLLAALPPDVRSRLLGRADEVALCVGDVVYRPGEPIRWVYFPRTGILSMVIDAEDGGTVEVGTVGNEGLAGLPALHRADRSPTRVYCQVPPCPCRRVPADLFVAEASRPGPLQDACHRYAQAVYNQTAQSVLCMALHPVEPRLARWMLLTQDRVGDEFPLTQQILSEMLGVRRSSVTLAAGAFQDAGLIRYRRGRIAVLDRARLEAASCECYRACGRSSTGCSAEPAGAVGYRRPGGRAAYYPLPRTGRRMPPPAPQTRPIDLGSPARLRVLVADPDPTGR
jgi:CRP-like cAMP-binding protein